MTTSRGKGHARRRRALAAADRLGEIVGDAIYQIGVEAQTEFVRRTRRKGSFADSNDDEPTPDIDPTGLFDEEAWAKAMDDASTEIGQYVVDEMGRVGLSARITQPFVQELVAAHMAELEAYGDDARTYLESTVTAALQEGASVQKTAAQLVARDMSPRAAMLVARTEMVSAGNGAAMVGAKAAAGPGAKKVWISTPDKRTRPDHLAADGQEVPLDQPFKVGGEDAEYPGHHGLSMQQRGNCRCSWYVSDLGD